MGFIRGQKHILFRSLECNRIVPLDQTLRMLQLALKLAM